MCVCVCVWGDIGEEKNQAPVDSFQHIASEILKHSIQSQPQQREVNRLKSLPCDFALRVSLINSRI